MTENTRAGLEGWFRYADELGLGPYYRDRATSKSFPSAPAAAPRDLAGRNSPRGVCAILRGRATPVAAIFGTRSSAG